MAGIPGVLYFLIGIAMSAYSKLGPNSGEPFVEVFFYVGVVFVFWGVVKMIFAPSGRRKKTLDRQDDIQGSGFRCPRCGTRNYSRAHYCHRCGYKLG